MSRAAEVPVTRPEHIRSDVADAMECERITRTHARTFSLASRLLPAPKRRAAFALYAFCRVADDLVDRAETSSSGNAPNTETLRTQLREYEGALQAALDGRASGPIFREVAVVVRQYGVPATPLFELLDGVARDLDTARYGSWTALSAYCEGVASSVGEMCTYVFGVQGPAANHERAVRYARTLGVAMQLTNILRDIGEDARRGRCYLPAEDLAEFGLTTDEVVDAARRGHGALARDERWREMMAYEVGRARALYLDAMPGIALLSRDAQRCAAACATGYAGILGAIEAQGYDTISSRARLGRLARAGILWDAWRFRASSPDSARL